MVSFHPRLHIDTETGGQIESTLMPLLESPTVIVADGYPFPLTAELVKDGVSVRAATGEEMTAFLTKGDIPDAEGLKWPGDPAMPTGREIEWQETQDSEVKIDRACHLWGGEVILKSGRGASSPFYVHKEAARAWALAAALSLPEIDVLGLQVVPYACVRHFAPELIKDGEIEFKRLNRFWISPVRSWGRVEQFALPGREF
ncbi:MAG: hypothetical protein B7Z77_07540 [Acidocella sp. 20-58-15]|nr:MAG: hypothetical protein B7Z77_07540 [Acidocella sp. 20-58-15]